MKGVLGEIWAVSLRNDLHVILLLPCIHLGLLGFVLLQKLVKNLFEAIGIGLQRRNDISDRTFNEHSINHAETFSILGKWFEGFYDQLVLLCFLLDIPDFLRKLL